MNALFVQIFFFLNKNELNSHNSFSISLEGAIELRRKQTQRYFSQYGMKIFNFKENEKYYNESEQHMYGCR